jgi:hypothetical protein
VLTTFANNIIEKLGINIFKYPTTPSIAFAVFRCKFLTDKSEIPIILGDIYKDIKLAYYGGFVDVYLPFGISIKGFDVNSLYPFVM